MDTINIKNASLLIMFCLTAAMSSMAQVRSVSRVSIANDGSEANDASFCAQVSDDGRYVAFSSIATNLVSNDTNGKADIFVRDTFANTTIRANLTSTGAEPNGDVSFGACDFKLDPMGRYVVFSSNSTNLLSDFTGGEANIYRYDLTTGTPILISRPVSGLTTDGRSQGPSISSDGRYVAFTSNATNLISEDTNSISDVFVYDVQNNTTERVSVASDGSQGDNLSYSTDISDDGRYVLFHSFASNLVANDTNGTEDLFVRDRTAGTTIRVNISSTGLQVSGASLNSALSGNGRYIVFASSASDLVAGGTPGQIDVYVHDRETSETTRVSVNSSGQEANGINFLGVARSSISTDGRFVTFGSYGDNLVPEDNNGNFDIFVQDRDLAKTLIGSVRPRCLSDSEQGNESSEGAAISGDGSVVVFSSIANNLVSNDKNNVLDIFLSEFIAPRTLKSGLKLTSPNISTCSNQATVIMPLFLTKATQQIIAQSKRIKNFRYQVEVTSAVSNERRRKIDKRNSLAFEDLPSGDYSSRFKMVQRKNGRYEQVTRFSSSKTFTIP